MDAEKDAAGIIPPTEQEMMCTKMDADAQNKVIKVILVNQLMNQKLIQTEVLKTQNLPKVARYK